jgi:hypothetical protein
MVSHKPSSLGPIETASDGAPASDLALRAALFEHAPLGLCLLVDGLPRRVNRRFARMLGGTGQESDWPAAELCQRWPELWPQLRGLGEEHRIVACAMADGAQFNGRAFSWRAPALGPGPRSSRSSTLRSWSG